MDENASSFMKVKIRFCVYMCVCGLSSGPLDPKVKFTSETNVPIPNLEVPETYSGPSMWLRTLLSQTLWLCKPRVRGKCVLWPQPGVSCTELSISFREKRDPPQPSTGEASARPALPVADLGHWSTHLLGGQPVLKH